jgi:thiol-disulfide isomerase/thioredoxin
MALTPSQNIPLGTKAVDFKLLDTNSNQMKTLQDLKSDTATVILFICNHCPFVKHIQQSLIELERVYMPKGISFVAINANDSEAYPDDRPEKMKEAGYPFPYLFDATQEVAKAYQAACTPDIYVFDKSLQCVYHGQFDDSRPGNDLPVTGADLKKALDCLLSGHPVNPTQKPSIGCNIKWKS